MFGKSKVSKTRAKPSFRDKKPRMIPTLLKFFDSRQLNESFILLIGHIGLRRTKSEKLRAVNFPTRPKSPTLPYAKPFELNILGSSGFYFSSILLILRRFAVES